MQHSLQIMSGLWPQILVGQDNINNDIVSNQFKLRGYNTWLILQATILWIFTDTP